MRKKNNVESWMNPVGYCTIKKNHIGAYAISTLSLNGRGYRTILLRPSENADEYLTNLGYEDNTTLYEAMNCHQAFMMTIVNRLQMKQLFEM